MTYGWAILLIAIVAAAIVSLGFVDTGSFIGSRSFGFSQVSPTGWRVDPSGALTLKLKNNAGSDINITSISATCDLGTVSNASAIAIANGAESTIFSVGVFPLPASSGQSYSVKISINYTDSETGFPYADSGTVSGKSL